MDHNIRELQNIIERATIFCKGRTLTASYLPRELRDQAKQTAMSVTHADGQVIRIEMQVGKHTLEETVRLADYNESLAAKQLGLTRFALDRRLKEDQKRSVTSAIRLLKSPFQRGRSKRKGEAYIRTVC